MEAFVSAQTSVPNAKTEDSRVSNNIVLKAIDKALRAGINRNLGEFLPGWRLRPCKADEMRYLCKNEDLPMEKRRPDTIGRVSVVHKSTGLTRLELPNEIITHDSLYIWSDQGSVGWVGYQYLFLWLGLMGFCFWDICHYVCNQIENGLKKAGCWFLVQELILVMNLVMGPYNGAAWFHTVKGSMEHYIAGATWECPLFRFFL